MREYQGVKMSWVELDRIVSEEIVRDDDIRRRVAESWPVAQHSPAAAGRGTEKSDLSVEVTPRETVEFIRQRHSAR